jgi:hypothetical protein
MIPPNQVRTMLLVEDSNADLEASVEVEEAEEAVEGQ